MCNTVRPWQTPYLYITFTFYILLDVLFGHKSQCTGRIHYQRCLCSHCQYDAVLSYAPQVLFLVWMLIHTCHNWLVHDLYACASWTFSFMWMSYYTCHSRTLSCTLSCTSYLYSLLHLPFLTPTISTSFAPASSYTPYLSSILLLLPCTPQVCSCFWLPLI